MKPLLALLIAFLAHSASPILAQENPPLQTANSRVDADLQRLLSSLQKTVNTTVASKQGADMATQLESLRIPKYRQWFPAMFGADTGTKLAAIYSDTLARSEGRLVDNLLARTQPGGQVTAKLASGGSETQVDEYYQQIDHAIRQSLKRTAVFYHLDYEGKSANGGYPFAMSFGYAILIDDSYRLLYDNVIRGLPDLPAVTRVRQGGKVTAAAVINIVQPVYPMEARRQRVSGTVRLHAIIANDGSVKNLEVVSGDELLVQAAIDAVQQWRYRPTMLEGQPVEVDTTIDVTFALNQPNKNPL